jgi:hypothetical protein
MHDTFLQKFLLAVLDKLLLAGVGLFLGYFLNKKLEKFRAQQSRAAEEARERRALEAEFFRERTKRLDELYSLMGALRDAAAIYVAAAHALRESRHTFTFPAIPVTTTSQWADLQKAGGDLITRAVRCRPWIGVPLAEACAQFHDHVLSSAREESFPGAPHDTEKIERLQKAISALEELFFDEIRRGAPAPAVKAA